MEVMRRVKTVTTSVDSKGNIYSNIEYIVNESYEIKNKKDITFVGDKLVDGFYTGALCHTNALKNLLSKKESKCVTHKEKTLKS